MTRKAVNHLRRVDPAMARVIDAVGSCRFQARSEGTHFGALLRAIVSQQLSMKAAATIHSRFLALYGGREPTPEALLATPEETLRTVGLSRQKLAYMRDLAAHVVSGVLPVDGLHELDDAALTAALVRVKGIGRWTAQMFLMFRLGRPNVLPDLDLGIQKGIQRAYGLPAMPTPKEVLRIGEKWAPYASIASWYLWRLLEVPVGDVGPAVKVAPTTRVRTTRVPTTRAQKKALATPRKRKGTAHPRRAKKG